MGFLKNDGRVADGDLQRARVLFVAGLTPIAQGGHGGVVTASMNVLRSKLAERVEFVPISTTIERVPPPPFPVRARAAARRTRAFVTLLGGVDAALVFSSSGWSMIEKGTMCAMARLAGRGVVVRFSSGDLPAQCEAQPALKAWLRFVLRSAHVVVSQGPKWSSYFGSYSEAAGKIIEIPNGVRLGPQAIPEPGRARVVFVGLMHRDKGIFEVLEAASRVRHWVPHVSFELIGGGRDLEQVRGEIRDRGLDRWAVARGWIDHDMILSRLTAADVFVLPSHFEGLPNAMLEAMAAGLPVVVTPVGSISDVVRNGENGLVVPPCDPAALASALCDLLLDPARARALGQRARATICERHDADRVWVGYAEALARACREAGRSVEVNLAAS